MMLLRATEELLCLSTTQPMSLQERLWILIKTKLINNSNINHNLRRFTSQRLFLGRPSPVSLKYWRNNRIVPRPSNSSICSALINPMDSSCKETLLPALYGTKVEKVFRTTISEVASMENVRQRQGAWECDQLTPGDPWHEATSGDPSPDKSTPSITRVSPCRRCWCSNRCATLTSEERAVGSINSLNSRGSSIPLLWSLRLLNRSLRLSTLTVLPPLSERERRMGSENL